MSSPPPDLRATNSGPITPEMARAMLAKLRMEDPLHHYKPGPTALKFHKSDTYCRLLTGGGQAGKSATAVAELVMLLRGIHPYKPWFGPISALVMCVSRQQAAMVVQDKMFNRCGWPDLPWLPSGIGNFPYVPKHEIKDIGNPKVGFRTVYFMELRNGSKVYFAWSGSENVYQIVQGPSLDVVYLDENVGERKLMIELRKRLLAKQNPNNWSGQLFWSATGTSINDEFEDFRNRCMDPKDKDHAYFEIQRGENPAVTSAAVERLSAVLTDDERAIHITGQKTAGSLVQIFARQWSDERHVLKADYEPQPADNLWLGYDPGVDHPTAMVICAFNEANPMKAHVVKCWAYSHQTNDHDLKLLEQWLRGRRLAGAVYDSAAGAETKFGISLIASMMQKMHEKQLSPHCGYFRSKKGHWKSISLVRHYLSPSAYDPDAEPLLVINPSKASGCQLLRWQMLKYSGKEETKFTGAGGVVKKDDDLIDALSYLITQRPGWVREYACGAINKVLPTPDSEPEDPPPAPAAQMTPYERQLAMSRDRTRTRGRTGLSNF